MIEALEMIRERLAKAEAEVTQAEKAWESAKNQAADLHTTLRVMSELSGQTPSPNPQSAPAAERQLAIVRMFGVEEQQAKAPSETFEMHKNPLENADGWTIQRSTRLPSATWIMTSDT
jgi:hypothetical protein